MVILVIVLLMGIGASVFLAGGRRGASTQALSDARAEAHRWHERLGGQLLNLRDDGGAARQALTDAAERYQAAGAQISQARTVVQYQLARETALERPLPYERPMRPRRARAASCNNSPDSGRRAGPAQDHPVPAPAARARCPRPLPAPAPAARSGCPLRLPAPAAPRRLPRAGCPAPAARSGCPQPQPAPAARIRTGTRACRNTRFPRSRQGSEILENGC
jgi:hypothetical protein